MLGIAGSKLGIIYALSALASWAYHKTNEEQFVFTDHALAWTAIAANFWMAIKTEDWKMTLFGALLVIKALDSYARAKDKRNYNSYEYNHTMWHFWCGAAGTFLVLGYKHDYFRGIYETYSKGLLH